jgi:hypothetical protein
MGARKEPMMIYEGSYEDAEYYIGNTKTWSDSQSFIEACKQMDDSFIVLEDTISRKWVRLVPGYDFDTNPWMGIHSAKPFAKGAFLAWHVDVRLIGD